MPYESAKDGKHYWLTPPGLYKELDDEFNFDFDPCPYPQPLMFDGLEGDWGKSNYVNPPFKGPTRWVRKCIEQYRNGKKVVFVFPVDKWLLELLKEGPEVRNLFDVKWHSIEENKPGKGIGRHIACFILDPNKQRR